jgi:hypothetical protein
MAQRIDNWYQFQPYALAFNITFTISVLFVAIKLEVSFVAATIDCVSAKMQETTVEPPVK